MLLVWQNRECVQERIGKYRELFNEYIKQLRLYSEEWATLIPMVVKPKCETLGYCPEKYSCGRKPRKD